jgi:hypothetical protein
VKTGFRAARFVRYLKENPQVRFEIMSLTDDEKKEPILQLFRYTHLRYELQEISRPFSELAYELVENVPRNPERTVALRKLKEAKDAAVQAFLYETD